MRKQLFCCVCIGKVGLNLNGGEFQMPNAKVLSEKQAIVAELTEKLKTASSGVLVDYKGITVAQDTALRAECRKNELDYACLLYTSRCV